MDENKYQMGNKFVFELHLKVQVCVVSMVLHVFYFHKSPHYHPSI
jgi:hypothetical protein